MSKDVLAKHPRGISRGVLFFVALRYTLTKKRMFFFGFIIFLIGAVVGSFVDALVWRTKERLPIVFARSICTTCHAMISWFDNIPIFSFFILRGRCRSCQTPIAFRYPIVEAIVGVLFVVVGYAHRFSVTPEFIRDAFLATLLVVVFLYDFFYGEILDRFTTIPAIILFFASLVFGWATPQSMGLGIALGAGFFFAQFIVSKGRWIGGGDIRLGAFMGVVLGWPNILSALFFAYTVGALVSIVLLAVKKKKMTDETPFGTYLALGTFATMLYGDRMIAWYLGFLR